jgi:hypothetical protein
VAKASWIFKPIALKLGSMVLIPQQVLEQINRRRFSGPSEKEQWPRILDSSLGMCFANAISLMGSRVTGQATQGNIEGLGSWRRE